MAQTTEYKAGAMPTKDRVTKKNAKGPKSSSKMRTRCHTGIFDRSAFSFPTNSLALCSGKESEFASPCFEIQCSYETIRWTANCQIWTLHCIKSSERKSHILLGTTHSVAAMSRLSKHNILFRTTLLLLAVTTVFSLFVSPVQASSSDKCTSASSFFCPNCGGIQVSDCLDCDGFRSADPRAEICFDRRLFQARNVDETDHENYYRFLWHDLAGAIIWFLMAGVATACGVGGGGIYVPLGHLLLQFAPKPASGLSQASIFGASLGGILLNARCRHPVHKIRHDPPAEATEEERLGHRVDLTPLQEKAYTTAGNKFYTRPLINFDMALFLSPMEMAGAVLGVLIQTILPNWLYVPMTLDSFTFAKGSHGIFLCFYDKQIPFTGCLGIGINCEKDVYQVPVHSR